MHSTCSKLSGSKISRTFVLRTHRARSVHSTFSTFFTFSFAVPSPSIPFLAGEGAGRGGGEMPFVREGVKIKPTVVAKQPLLHPSIQSSIQHPPSPRRKSRQQECNATEAFIQSLITPKENSPEKVSSLQAGIVRSTLLQLHSASSLPHQSLERKEQ